ncbi:MAG: zinc protease [Pseudonocardiales bacterium]|jgi:predicted Zn-dependent peptidase|nr:zinc protease [Pseudonocardiales bacterium]
MSPATVPALTTPRKPKGLRATEAVLDNGLNVIAVRKPGVPLVEMRLRLPFLSAKPMHPAQATLLSEAMLTGAAGLDRVGLAAAVQALGGDVSVNVDADRLIVGGNVLATNLRKLLDVVASVLVDPTYDKDDVATEKDRLLEKLTIARARPGVVASEALALRMWGEHPYALDLARPDDVAAVTPGQVRAMHRSLVRPSGAVLVLVGDVAPGRMIEQAQKALAGWTGKAPKARVPDLPPPPGGPLQIVDRRGAVQSTLRMGGPALTRTDERYPALQLANLIFGGYFTSRWTENLREDKGYTYGPHSRVDHHVLGSTLGLNVELATEVTAPALLETLYELGRISALPVTETEVASVQQYAIGTLALSTATQSGLASTLSGLSAFGLGLDWITDHPARLLATTVEDVSAAAAEFFAPTAFTSVVVGDADVIADPLAALVAVER